MKKVAILFDNFGPYHLARLKAASEVCELLAVEFGSSSSEYDWEASETRGLKRAVLNPKGESHQMDNDEFRLRLDQILNDFHPQVVVVPGWGYRGALLALSWCLKNKIPAVVMSESTAWDEKRSPLKEWVKSRIVSLFSAALVGGTPHRAYLEKLGFPPKRIFLGYDAVDNRFFGEEAREIGSRRLEMGGARIKKSGVRSRRLKRNRIFWLQPVLSKRRICRDSSVRMRFIAKKRKKRPSSRPSTLQARPLLRIRYGDSRLQLTPLGLLSSSVMVPCAPTSAV